jgi:adenylate kinase family enzyme
VRHRILVKGSSGAGKTTLAAALAERLDLPHVELDALHHGPNWTAASAAELQARVLRILDDERGWVVDGNYESKLGSMIVERAEVIVWLDLPLKTKLARLGRRTASRWLRNQELWNGNRETLRAAFWGREALFPWAVRSHFRHRREWPEKLAGHEVTRLRTTLEVAHWLSSFVSTQQADQVTRTSPRVQEA